MSRKGFLCDDGEAAPKVVTLLASGREEGFFGVSAHDLASSGRFLGEFDGCWGGSGSGADEGRGDGRHGRMERVGRRRYGGRWRCSGLLGWFKGVLCWKGRRHSSLGVVRLAVEGGNRSRVARTGSGNGLVRR